MILVIYPNGMEIVYNEANLLKHENNCFELYKRKGGNEEFICRIPYASGASAGFSYYCSKVIPNENIGKQVNSLLRLSMKNRTAKNIKRIFGLE